MSVVRPESFIAIDELHCIGTGELATIMDFYDKVLAPGPSEKQTKSREQVEEGTSAYVLRAKYRFGR